MPAKKHQRASEAGWRKRAATAIAPLKNAAAKASQEVEVTSRGGKEGVKMSEDQRSEVRKEPGALIIVPSILPMFFDKAVNSSCSAVEM